MCGIAGFFGKEKIPTILQIKKTLDLMKVRGQDGISYIEKKFKKKKIIFLHSRLSIIDPSKKAAQPFVDDEGMIVFNGMIYNYIEIKKILETKKIFFRTNSDTEVLLKFLNYFGPSKINSLEGMWSFAYFNFKRKKIILSRDRFGEKPLYYYFNKSCLIFGSNLNYINSLYQNNFEINHQKVNDNLVYGYENFNNEKTFFKKILSLKPGNNFEIDLEFKKKKKKYWNFTSLKINKKSNYLIEKVRLKKIIFDNIKKKLRTDFPIACLLSSGVDSSIIASVSNIIKSKQIKCFSIKASEKNYDESVLIRKNIKKIGCKHNFIQIPKKNYLLELQNIIRKTSSVLPSLTWLVFAVICERIKRLGFKVVLSGTGGDEMFAGYYIHHLQYLKSIKNKTNFKYNYNFWKKNTARHVRSEKLKNFQLYLKNDKKYPDSHLEKIEFEKYFKKNKKKKVKKYFNNSFKNELFKDIFYQTLPAQLYASDNISMFYGIETRSPFVSEQFFYESFKYPNHFLINKGVGKKILRDSMNGIVHKSILENTNKIGLFSSIKNFFNLNSSQFKKVLFSNSYINSLINREKVEEILKKKYLNHYENHLVFNILNHSIFLNCNKKN